MGLLAWSPAVDAADARKMAGAPMSKGRGWLAGLISTSGVELGRRLESAPICF